MGFYTNDMRIEADKGVNIYGAIKKAKDALNDSNILEYDRVDGETKYGRFKEKVTLVFNEIEVDISTNSNVDDIAVIYNLKSEIRRLEI